MVGGPVDMVFYFWIGKIPVKCKNSFSDLAIVTVKAN